MSKYREEGSRGRRHCIKLQDFSEPLKCLPVAGVCGVLSLCWPQNLYSFMEHLMGLLFS